LLVQVGNLHQQIPFPSYKMNELATKVAKGLTYELLMPCSNFIGEGGEKGLSPERKRERETKRDRERERERERERD
jgi:hypothetical protein